MCLRAYPTLASLAPAHHNITGPDNLLRMAGNSFPNYGPFAWDTAMPGNLIISQTTPTAPLPLSHLTCFALSMLRKRAESKNNLLDTLPRRPQPHAYVSSWILGSSARLCLIIAILIRVSIELTSVSRASLPTSLSWTRHHGTYGFSYVSLRNPLQTWSSTSLLCMVSLLAASFGLTSAANLLRVDHFGHRSLTQHSTSLNPLVRTAYRRMEELKSGTTPLQ